MFGQDYRTVIRRLFLVFSLGGLIASHFLEGSLFLLVYVLSVPYCIGATLAIGHVMAVVVERRPWVLPLAMILMFAAGLLLAPFGLWYGLLVAGILCLAFSLITLGQFVYLQ